MTELQESKHVSLTSSKKFQSWFIPEPLLVFGNGKTHIDPKIGLTLYGPLRTDPKIPTPTSISVGIIGTGETIGYAKTFLQNLMKKIPSSNDNPFHHPPFPGFQDAFSCILTLSDDFNETITTFDVTRAIEQPIFEQRVEHAVKLFLDKIENISERVPRPNVVVCALPQNIVDTCVVKRTSSGIVKTKKQPKRGDLAETLKHHIAENQTFLDNFKAEALKIIEKDVQVTNFWRALKAGSMSFGMPTQIVWPSTTKPKKENEKQDRQDPATIAWNFSVALHYKGSGFPWTMTRMKQGTCYVGITFFKDLTDDENRMRTSMAQVFTYTGEGLVIRGDRFEWNTFQDRSPHLDEKGAEELLKKAIELYTNRIGQSPLRVVVHKSSKYWDDEKKGFENALKEIKMHDLVAIGERDIRFFRYGQFPPLRGTVIQLGKTNYLLYTRGFTPYLRTYPGAHVPLPLDILEHHGDSPRDVILTEILALSKMNWNSAEFSLAKPITLLFSKRVGEIMASLPDSMNPRHEYLYYM
ncbi:MAG: hypothetical protein K8Q89_03450 [Nitrosarchaeum sp.]|nr:hypothetical protein [Nitrosarchaeum sp.]